MAWFNFTNKLHLNSTMNNSDGNGTGTIHNCIDQQCDGANHGGIKISCSWCQQTTFLSCLLHCDEFKCLVNSLVPKANTDSLTQSQCVSVKQPLETLLQSESCIDFVCFECKSLSTFKDIEKAHEDRLINEKKISSGTSASIVMLKQQHTAAIETLSQQLTLANAKIDELKASANINTRNNCDDIINKRASFDSLLSDLISASQNQKKNLQQLSRAIHEALTPLNAHTIDLTNTSSFTSDDKHTNAPPDLSSKLPREQNKSRASNLPHIVENKPPTNLDLRPPSSKDAAEASSSSDNVFDIYVSKFETDVECEGISNHIIRELKIKNDDFTVTKLVNDRILKSENFSYVSFKVSTNDQNIYNHILNDKLWAPDFSAVPFNKKSSRKRDNKNKMKNDSEKQKQPELRPPKSVSSKNGANQNKNRRSEKKETRKNVGATQREKTNNQRQKKVVFRRGQQQFSPHNQFQSQPQVIYQQVQPQ